MAWQAADLIEGPPDFAGQPCAAPDGRLVTEQKIHGHVEDARQLPQMFGPERRLAALPAGETLLCDPEMFRDLGLGKTEFLPG